MLLPPALLLLALWFTHRMDADNRAVMAPAPVDRVKWSLRERLVRGEINADEFRRLRALMHLTD